MATHEGYLDAYNTNMVFIATLMLLNLAGVLFLMFLADSFVDEDERQEGHIGVLPWAIAWMASFFITSILALWIFIRKSKNAVMWGLILAWGQSMFLPSMTSSTIFWVVSSIFPLVLTALVIRLLWLQDKIAETRPPPPVTYYPIGPYQEPPNGSEHLGRRNNKGDQ